jgi:hypothetical protein
MTALAYYLIGMVITAAFIIHVVETEPPGTWLNPSIRRISTIAGLAFVLLFFWPVGLISVALAWARRR